MFSDFGSTNLTKSMIARCKKTVWTAWTELSPLSLYPKKNGNVIWGLSSKGKALSTLSSLSGPKNLKKPVDGDVRNGKDGDAMTMDHKNHFPARQGPRPPGRRHSTWRGGIFCEVSAMRKYKTTPMQRAKSLVTKITIGKHRDMDEFSTEIGCTGSDLKWHIERQFERASIGDIPMTWRNRSQWEVDHISPVKMFCDDLEQDVFECNHWSNLRPIWPEHNTKRTTQNTTEFGPGPDYRVFKGRSPRETCFDSNGDLKILETELHP